MQKFLNGLKSFAIRNRLAAVGGIVVLIFVFMGIFAPLITPHDPYKIDIINTLSKPSANHWLGTDYIGRDL